MVPVDLEYSFPLGFRFHPTDEELLNHYLKLKTLGSDSHVRAIPVIDICNWEPWELPTVFHLHFSITSSNLSGIHNNDHQWYFFCPRDGSSRVNRSTNTGYWKPTGADRTIKSRNTGDVIGSKKTLVFFEGRAPNPTRTNWVIHEYQLNPKKAFVLCVLKEIRDGNARCEVEPSSVNGTDFSHITATPNNSHLSNHVASGVENQVAELSPEDQAFISRCLYNQPTYAYQQPQMYPEPGLSTMDSRNPNGFSNNHQKMQFQTNTKELYDDDGYFNWENFEANPSDGYTEAERSILFPVESTLAESNPDNYTMEESSRRSINLITRIKTREAHVRGSSNSPQYKREDIYFLGDESGGWSASSVENQAEESRGKTSCITAKHEGRPDSVKSTATAAKVPEKENSNVVSKNDLGIAGGRNTKMSLKPREHKESSGRNQKGSINFPETPIAGSHRSSPPHCSDVKDSKSGSETDTEALQSRPTISAAKAAGSFLKFDSQQCSELVQNPLTSFWARECASLLCKVDAVITSHMSRLSSNYQVAQEKIRELVEVLDAAKATERTLRRDMHYAEETACLYANSLQDTIVALRVELEDCKSQRTLDNSGFYIQGFEDAKAQVQERYDWLDLSKVQIKDPNVGPGEGGAPGSPSGSQF